MADEATTTEPTTDQQQAATADAEVEGADALGDKGKQALDRMKAERNQYKADMAMLRAEFDAFKAKAEGREAEHAAALEAQRVKDEALAAANRRILQAEVRAAAAGKLSDPADALRFIDLSSFEVGDDGATDAAAIAGAVEDLVKSKPYLAAAQQRRFEGGADGGVRNGQPADLQTLIAEATKAGNHVLAIALKRQLSDSLQQH